MPRFMKAKVDRDGIFGAMMKVAKKNDASITEDDDLDQIISAILLDYPKDLFDKVEFDTENVIFNGFDGLHGSHVCWAYAGGDWETPVNFIIYVDDKDKLRFYIPSDGNTYCHKCKHAYGSCECEPENQCDVEEDFAKMYKDAEKRLQLK